MTDLALLERWLDRRDAQAFKEIVARYASMVYATCLRILRNSADAEDVTQECFETLALGRGRPVQDLAAWLHRIATNRALDRIRSEQRRQAREAKYAAEQPVLADPEWGDIYASVDEAIAALPEELRAPLVAHYLLGQSHAEIAAASGVPRRTVSHRVERGVDRIGELLRKRGVTIGSAALAALMASNMASASALPPSLTATLGKLALAQSANAPAAAGTLAHTAKLLGGTLIMKKYVAAIVVVVGALLAYWGLKPEASTPDATHPQVVNNSSQANVSSQPTAQNDQPSETAKPLDPTALDDAVSGAELDGCKISGRVVDAGTGAGVAGTTVAAAETMADYADTSPRVETVSDENGAFEIAGLQPGFYLVMKKAGPDDYMESLPEDIVDLQLRDGQHRENIVLSARKGGTVEGRITDPRGRPVAGASVTIASASNQSFQGLKATFSSLREQTKTGASGRYIFRGVAPGKKCAVMAGAPGYTPARSAEFSLAAPSDRQRVDLQLMSGSSISGWVVDRDGNYMPGMDITLQPDYEGRSYVDIVALMDLVQSVAGLKTDANGAFQIDGLPGGAYHLFAGGLKRSPYSRPEGGGTRVELDGTTGVDGVVVRAYSLGRGEHRLTGHVVNLEGAPINGAQVDLLALQRPGYHYTIQTDEAGAFLIDGIGDGDFLLVVTAAAYSQAAVNSPPLDGPDLTITLQNNVTVRGRVLEKKTSTPVPGAKITVFQHDRTLRPLPQVFGGWLPDRFDSVREGLAAKEVAVSGGDGAFQLLTEPGALVLKAARYGYASANSELVSVEPESAVEDVVIYMSRGSAVEGIVLTVDGAPVAGAAILVAESQLPGESPAEAELRLSRAANMGQGSRYIRGLTGPAGRFIVEGLAEGNYWMRAIADGYADSRPQTVPVSGNGIQAEVELVLDPGGTVKGRITGNGMPKADIIVEATLEDSGNDYQRFYTSDDGYYRFDNVAPGEQTIRVVDYKLPNNAGIQSVKVNVVSGETVEQNFDFSGHTLRGAVAGLANPAEWQVALLNVPEGVDPEAPPDSSIDWTSLVASTSSIYEDGGYLFAGLPDGVYKLEVFQSVNNDIVYKGVWKTVEIKDEDLVVDLYVKP